MGRKAISTGNSVSHRKREAWDKAATWIIVCLFFSYVFFRIIMVPLVNDEWGILHCAYRGSFADLFAFTYIDAQNHFLAGLLSMVCLRTLPLDEVVAIRIPSILALVLFLYSAVRITRTISSGVLRIATLFALCGNAFQLDFFGLSRGYGLSLGFTLLSLTALVESTQKGRASTSVSENANIEAKVALWAAFFAVLATLSFLNYYLSVVIVLLAVPLIKGSSSLRSMQEIWRYVKSSSYIFYISGILFAFYLSRILLLMKYNKLYFGGNDGFVADTIASLLSTMFYLRDPISGTMVGFAWGITILTLLLFAVTLFRHMRVWRSTTSVMPSLIMCSILVTAALLSIVQHYLVGVLFMLERAALFFLPLWVCTIAFVSAETSRRWIRYAGVMILLGYACVGVSRMNFTHTLTWRETSEHPQLIEDLRGILQQTHNQIVLGVSDECKYTAWYYIEKTLGMQEDPRTKEHGFFKIFGRLVMYSLHSFQSNIPFHTLKETTHLFVSYSDGSKLDEVGLKSCLRLLKKYPTARCMLFEVIAPLPDVSQ